MKKYILGLVLLAFISFAPFLAKAYTQDEIRTQITAIQAQIITLQDQLASLKKQLTNSNPNPSDRALEVASEMASFNRTLRIGIKGDDVKAVQRVLREKGYLHDIADGSFGPKTAEAVKAYQRANTLTEDGVLGPKTLAVISGLLIRADLVSSPQVETPQTTGFTLPSTPNSNAKMGCSPTDDPSITIISPNGGEVYTAGQQITVTWTSCNVPESQNLRISIETGFTSGGGSFGYSPAQSTPNDGLEVITIPVSSIWGPTTAGDNNFQYGNYFKIHISEPMGGSTVGIGTDYSDNFFTINPQGPLSPTKGCTSTLGFSPLTGASCSGTPQAPASCSISKTPVTVTLDGSTPPSQTLPAGSTDVDFGHFKVSTVCQVNVTGFTFSVLPSSTAGNFQNLKLFMNGNQIGQTIPSGLPNTMQTFNLGSGVVIPANSSVIFTIKADISPSAQPGVTMDIAFTNNTGLTAVDSLTGSNISMLGINKLKRRTVTIATNPIATPVCTTRDPSITVLSPNGGEVWGQNNNNYLQWAYCNIPANGETKISLINQSTNFIQTVYDPIGYNGSLPALYPFSDLQRVMGPVVSGWSEPTLPQPGQYKVRLECSISGIGGSCNPNSSTSYFDDSDYSFTINP